jgi:AcrR family transcriptional regulator
MTEGPRSPLSADDWTRAAVALLADHGIESVRVDVLARRLGVSRGSFYWHFKDRAELLQSVLRAWKTFATDQVIERFETSRTDPHTMIRELISLPFRGQAAASTARVELAIRSWARSDDVARQAVDEVDARRIAFHAQVFSSLGFSIAEARARAVVLYGYEVAESLLFSQGSASQKAERRALMEQLVLARLPAAP